MASSLILSCPEIWDRASREYDSNIGARALKGAEDLVAAALDQKPFSDDSKVLDVGTGSGSIPVVVRGIEPTVPIVAIDSSSGMIDILARRGLSNITTGIVDARSFDREIVPKGAFTHAFCALVLQFVDDRQLDVLSEIFHSLQPGGVIAVSISSYLGITEPMHDACKLVDPLYSRVEPFGQTWHTTAHLHDGLKAAGFVDIKVFDIVTENRAPSPESIIDFWVNMRNPGLRPVMEAFQGRPDRLREVLRDVLGNYEENFAFENQYAAVVAKKAA